MATDDLLRERREEILRIAAKHGARNVRVFGSVAREEADERSDIDFLVEMEPGRSLLDLGGLQYELERLLDCPVDVVTERGLYWLLRRRILKEGRPLGAEQGGPPAVTKDPRAYLVHILECIQKIERFTADGRERFFRDALVQAAVLRNLEVIGEAAKGLDGAYWVAPRSCRGARTPVCGTCSSTSTRASTWRRCGPSSRNSCPHRAAPSLPCCRPSSSLHASWAGRTNRPRSRDRANSVRALQEPRMMGGMVDPTHTGGSRDSKRRAHDRPHPHGERANSSRSPVVGPSPGTSRGSGCSVCTELS